MRLWKGRPKTSTFEAFGVRVGLHVADPELETALADMLRRTARTSSPCWIAEQQLSPAQELTALLDLLDG